MLKADAKFKKLKKSGKKIEFTVISESFPEVEWKDGHSVSNQNQERIITKMCAANKRED